MTHETGDGAGRDEPTPSLALRALRALHAGEDRPEPQPELQPEPQPEPETTVDADGSAAETTAAEPVAEPITEPVAEPATEPVTAQAAEKTSAARGARPWGVLASAALLAAAVVFCAVASVVWKGAADDTTASRAAVRDAVLRGARIGITTVNTSDYHDPGKVLDAWTAVSTGGLAKQYKDNRADAIAVLGRAKVVTTATVLDAAVTALDPRKGTATVIASVDVVRTPVSGTKARTRNRFQATLQKVGSAWLLSGVKIVPVQLS